MDDRVDLIDLLNEDHLRIRKLADQLDNADDPAEIRHLFLQIVEELAAHEAAEQQVLFPAFHTAVESADDSTIAHRLGEHEELNELLTEMRVLAPDGFGFTKRASALMLEVRAHFQLEEDTVFDRMRTTFDPEQLKDLGKRALAVKRHAPAFPADPDKS